MEELKNRLYEALQIRDITQIELAEKTKIPKSSINQYLSGYANPKSDRIHLIAKALDVSETWLIGYDVPIKDISPKKAAPFDNYEQNLIYKYRQLDDYAKDTISYMIDRELNRSTTFNEDDSDYKLITLYGDCRVSAGVGNLIFDNPPTDTIKVPNTKEFAYADYAIYVCGDSMTPLYQSGDIVAVQVTQSIEIGEIGIFTVDGESFIKKLGKDELISLNSDYKAIKIDENARCMGRVVGRI